MLIKLTPSICLMFLSYANLVGSEVDFAVKEYVDGEEIEKRPDLEALHHLLERALPPCDVAGCTLMDCNESGPPPFCPRNVTFCRSGCACIKYCKDPDQTRYCYQVKYCKTPRLFSPDVFTTQKMDFE